MTLIRNLFFLFAVTCFAAVSTILAVFNYNPFDGNISVFVDFYSSLFFSVTGIIALTVYYLRTKILKNQTIGNIYFWSSVREGCLVAAAIVVIMILKGYHILDWLIGFSTIIIAILLELFFQTKKEKVV